MDYDLLLEKPASFRICFVCTGNICRSPMAEVIFKQLAKDAGLEKQFTVFSAGTGDWHVGEPADPRTLAALDKHGFNGQAHRAKQFNPDWFPKLDLIVAFDRGQERILKSRADETEQGKVRLLLSFDSDYYGNGDVPDPYYSEDEFFDEVLAMIQRASQRLFKQLEPAIRQGMK